MSKVDKAWLEKLYKAFNKGEIETVLAAMTDDISWPDVEDEYGYARIKGKDNLREYWHNKLAVLDVVATPISITQDKDGHPIVTVRHVIRDRSGRILSDRDAKHKATLRDGLIARMDLG